MSLAANGSLLLGLALALAGGYLLGSIPVGLILAKLAGLGDLRQIGSGNIGATNVLRTGNKGLAALTLMLDALKGTAAVFLGSHWGLDGAMLGGLGAFLGHVFPVWLGFHGGKGVATYIGVLLGLYWPLGIVFCALWLVVALVAPSGKPTVQGRIAGSRQALASQCGTSRWRRHARRVRLGYAPAPGHLRQDRMPHPERRRPPDDRSSRPGSP